MSINPTDFLESAKKLQSEPDEASTRNAISRAYYAAYHLARTVFPPDANFAKANPGGVHATYIEQLSQADPGSPERLVAVKLNTLKGRRTKADYLLDCDIKPYVAAMQIVMAEEIETLLSTPQTNDSPATSNPPVATSRPKLERIR